MNPCFSFVFVCFFSFTCTPRHLSYTTSYQAGREKERKSKLNLETTKKGGQRGVKLCISMEISKTLLLFPSLSSAEEGLRRRRGKGETLLSKALCSFFHCLSVCLIPMVAFSYVMFCPLLSFLPSFASQCLTTKEKEKYRLKYHNLISIATN